MSSSGRIPRQILEKTQNFHHASLGSDWLTLGQSDRQIGICKSDSILNVH